MVLRLKRIQTGCQSLVFCVGAVGYTPARNAMMSNGTGQKELTNDVSFFSPDSFWNNLGSKIEHLTPHHPASPQSLWMLSI